MDIAAGSAGATLLAVQAHKQWCLLVVFVLEKAPEHCTAAGKQSFQTACKLISNAACSAFLLF
jgi:hypothetical protein